MFDIYFVMCCVDYWIFEIITFCYKSGGKLLSLAHALFIQEEVAEHETFQLLKIILHYYIK